MHEAREARQAAEAEAAKKAAALLEKSEVKVDDPSQSARAFYVSSPEPKD